MTIEEYLRGLLALMLFDNCGVECEEDERYITVRISLPEEESGILIGRHGETLSSLRKLLHCVFAGEIGEKRIVLHINDYRNQREEKIRQLIERGVGRIQQTGRPYRLYRLNAAERFFAHNLIASEQMYQGYQSHSEDDEDGGRVLIIEEKPDAAWADSYDGADD